MKRMHEREVASQDPEIESQGHGTLQDPELEPPEEDALPVHDFPDVQNVDEGSDDPAGDEVADEGEEKLTVDVDNDLPVDKYPTVEEYKARWDRRLAKHSKAVPGGLLPQQPCSRADPRSLARLPTCPVRQTEE